ncbi:MAG: Na/Pi cotransporter family protein [Lachnospiraceae bacterium]|nr:Na/Pi cotransporter family protein [Lachnospiraceae bacterium]
MTTMETVQVLFQFMGGLGMFLYGMHIMAEGMQKSAGNNVKKLLGFLTNNRLMAILVGALITAIIQSSGATTVMVVGFVNAGILSLTQAVGVIMGANIGTTITAWIVSLSQLGDAFEIMKPAFYAPMLIGVGALMVLFCKKQKKITAGEIFIGVALLFIGLEFMSGSIAPFTDAPIFSKAFQVLGGNPILGIIIGALVTMLLQSSSASVGILQTLAMNGVVTTNAAIFITLGQNIGSCFTAILSCAGAGKNAKRAAAIHLMFNVIGALIFGGVLYAVFLIRKDIAGHNITNVEISVFHTIFNFLNTAMLFPFAKQLVSLSKLIIKDGGDDEVEEVEALVGKHLDDRLLMSSSAAVEAVIDEVVRMGRVTLQNSIDAVNSVMQRDSELAEKVVSRETTINNLEKLLTEYLVKINNLPLTEEEKLVINNLFYTISDIERVGDHAENIAETAQYLITHDLAFSDTAIADLEEIGGRVVESFAYAIDARETNSMESLRKVSQYEDMVDTLEEELREKHIQRLSNNQCKPSAGVMFLDIVSNLERMSDHAYNIAGYVKDEM